VGIAGCCGLGRLLLVARERLKFSSAKWAREINSACARGLLECRPQMFAEIPRVTDEQIALIPARYLDALDMLTFREAPGLGCATKQGG